MVDEKKVRAMIELARYEEGEGREDLRIRRFYRGDFLTVQLIKNWILIGYVALIGLYLAITYISSAVRYGRARKRLREYVVKLRSLYRMK